jgi:uroporphyrin-III C-methyltransferase / precorrin-2 dehydrogenase / sirohydrochlorin ferrochelatase
MEFSKLPVTFGRIFCHLFSILKSYIEEYSRQAEGRPMRFLPVFLDLAAGTVVLAGSGAPARAKLALLRAAGARVRWYVDHATSPCEAADAAVEIMPETAPDEFDLSDAIAVVAAAGEPRDPVIAARARALRIPVNVVDRPDLSTFIVPAIVDRGDVVVAIGTGGLAPVLARRLRARIEALLPARIGELAALMGRYRARLAKAVRTNVARRRFWERVVDGPIGASLLAGRPLEAEAALARAIRDGERQYGKHQDGNRGTIVLVGAGPGDPDLLTLRALNVLQDADVIAHDDGVSAAVLDRVRRDAERIVLGHGGDPIERRLVAAARAGRQVVLLTRGEAIVGRFPFLRAAGVPVFLVPGVAAPGGLFAAVREAA